MDKHHLSNDDFFVRLASLFDSQRKEGKGSVFLTQKRLSSSTGTKPPGLPGKPDDLSDLQLSSPVPILIRATNGKSKEKRKDKIKVSTIVNPEELETFFTRYAEACKSGMSGLKKRDRSGAKAKAKAKARRERRQVVKTKSDKLL